MAKIDDLVQRFLTWPVPSDVHPDGTPGQPGRTGTNLMTAAQAKGMLQHVLGDELNRLRAEKDGAYLERNRCVALIARMAVELGYHVAVTKTAIEGWSEDWHGCVYIALPTGQVSWHFHDSQASLFDGLPRACWSWDGHDTAEKYRRVDSAFRS